MSHLTLAAGFPETRVKPANTLLAMMTLPDLVVMVVAGVGAGVRS